VTFDWEEFFRQNGIEYRTSGPNTSKGQAVISCCWCGADDPSMHLSVSLQGHGFRCWRHPEHRGKNPAKLIQALLNCSWDRANQIAGNNTYLPDNFMAKVRLSLADEDDVKPIANNLKLPDTFYQFSNKPSARLFINYLHGRHFTDADIAATKDYGIYYCTRGPFKGRIIFTVTFEGQLCGWTGRTIYDTQMLRYKTLSNDFEKAGQEGLLPAPNPISHYLLWYDKIKDAGADTIILSEGPFDAWRLNLLGKRLGVVATCFFTSSLSQTQLQLLHELLPKFKHRYLMLDANTLPKALHMKSDLMALGVDIKHLPAGVKDPGDVRTEKQLQELL
jgi:hypothetical protein